MRRGQRRDSAREWIRTSAAVTVNGYAKRYGVARYTAYEDLTALGIALPGSARQWAQRPPATPRRTARHGVDQHDDETTQPHRGVGKDHVTGRQKADL